MGKESRMSQNHSREIVLSHTNQFVDTSAEDLMLERLEAQVEIQRKTLRDNHSETLETTHELNLEYQWNGQWEKSEELQRRIIEVRKKNLGESHAETLRSMLDLASILYGIGSCEAGDQLQLDVLATRERVLGKQRADTIESVEQLAISCEDHEQWDKTLLFYARLEEASTATQGPDDPATLEASCAIARMYMRQGRSSEARKRQNATYQRSLAEHGPDNDCTLAIVSVLARIAKMQGNIQGARVLQQGVLDRFAAKYGRYHPLTMECSEDMHELMATGN